MAEQQMEVMTTILENRAPELASEKDPEEIKAMVKDAANQAKSFRTPIETDVWIYRGTVVVLGIVAIVVVVSQFFLASSGVDGKEVKIPEGLVAIGAAAIGALAGLLAPTGGRG